MVPEGVTQYCSSASHVSTGSMHARILAVRQGGGDDRLNAYACSGVVTSKATTGFIAAALIRSVMEISGILDMHG